MNAGFTDLHDAKNKATAGNGSSITTVPVQFPQNVEHAPQIVKEPAGFDRERKLVYWTIRVSAAEGSAYPLRYVDVYENLNGGVVWKNSYQGTSFESVDASDLLMTEAVVTTDSGVVLQAGEDYTIGKNGITQTSAQAAGESQNSFWMANGTFPSFSFPELNEGVTIRLAYGIKDNNIINGFEAHNKATVASMKDQYSYFQAYDDAEQTYETTDIDVTKNGKVEDSRYIKWTVRINPSRQPHNPDTQSVIFDDILPEGHVLVNYLDKENHNNPTIYVT